jgi:uncharacterized damage-inducible protein DinB
MATTADLLLDSLARVRETAHWVLDDTPEHLLATPPAPGANTVAWLVWHLTRVQDDHVAEVAGVEQVYTAQGFGERFELPFGPSAIGYGHSSADVAKVRPESPDLLLAYHDAVHDQTVQYLRGITDADLDRVVDERWDPPVTLGVRLVSVVNDDLQHAGQAAFVRGIAERR